MMKMRFIGNSRPEVMDTVELSHAGATTCTLGAPNMERANCCRNSPTPQVASRVSRGRRYRKRITVFSTRYPAAAAVTKETGMAMRKVTPAWGVAGVVAGNLLQGVGGIGPHHDELAVGQVDYVHQPEGQS